MPSLNVHGTKKKVVGFVDQVSPDRYRIAYVTQTSLAASLSLSLSSPNSDSSEAGSKHTRKRKKETDGGTRREVLEN